MSLRNPSKLIARVMDEQSRASHAQKPLNVFIQAPHCSISELLGEARSGTGSFQQKFTLSVIGSK
jgi:hypothetical protein